MKRPLFQLFNLLMACVVLLSSTGFGLVEHSCQMRGKKKTVVVAFSDVKPQKGCATTDQPMPSDQTVVKKTECCQDEGSFENVDAQSSLSQLVAKFVKTATETVLASVAIIAAYLIEWIFEQESSALARVESPPALSGRDILTLVSSLLL
ncbi:MAG: hypothetical protein JWP57_2526 [Spirosoma sp.]|nr:hypothetical protein [Spirosoma sp.]